MVLGTGSGWVECDLRTILVPPFAGGSLGAVLLDAAARFAAGTGHDTPSAVVRSSTRACVSIRICQSVVGAGEFLRSD